MKIFKTIDDLKLVVQMLRNQGKSIGFVPTMGALHKGHLSLIEASKSKSDITVCSIFVNPTQFNVKEDFIKYPVTIDQDIELLTGQHCDILFLPATDEMYPKGKTTIEERDKIDFGFLNEVLEGEKRPGHFDGVAQIVEKLLQAVGPDHLYMGQKDYQQFLVVSHMLQTRKMEVELVMCPIVREPDGLAMSSRNVRLTPEHRKDAVHLSGTLFKMKKQLDTVPVSIILDEGKTYLQGFPNIVLEYLEIADATTLQPIRDRKNQQNVIICVAAYLGDVRLIDNVYTGQ